METKEKLPGKVILDVEPISCSMKMTRCRDPEFPVWDSLSMRLRLARRIDIQTPEDQSLNEAEWSITLYAGGSGNELTEQHNAIGMVSYLAELEPDVGDDGFPESCCAWVILDPPAFNVLRDMALSGKLPVAFRLHVRGMEYGWAPDGSAKVWDVKSHPNTVITEVEVITHLVRPPEPKEDEIVLDPFWEEPPPPSPELVTMHTMRKAIDQVNARLGWAVGLLAVIATVVILR